MTTPFAEKALGMQLRSKVRNLAWPGAALVVIGAVAVAVPIIWSAVSTVFAGWILIASAMAATLMLLCIPGAQSFFSLIPLASMSIGGGLLILSTPMSGEIGIAACLSALFMVRAAFDLCLGAELSPAPGWGWLLASALASLVLAVITLSGLPGTSLVALCIIIGANLISSGFVYWLVGRAAPRAADVFGKVQ